jgi:hypothetical protein
LSRSLAQWKGNWNPSLKCSSTDACQFLPAALSGACLLGKFSQPLAVVAVLQC